MRSINIQRVKKQIAPTALPRVFAYFFVYAFAFVFMSAAASLSLRAQEERNVFPDAARADSVRTPVWNAHPILKGAASMTLAGDRAKAGLFTLRFQYPDGLRLPPHTHPTELHTTVLQGALYVGFGAKWDTTKVIRILPGQFMRFPAGEPHFEYTVGETILQVSGMGPLETSFTDSTAKPYILPKGALRSR
jgi:quercetin dioxygenase-like cupin family protein